jgi:hypothetical protein
MTGNGRRHFRSRGAAVDHGDSAWRRLNISKAVRDAYDWYSRDRYKPGECYVDSDGLFALRYLGIVSAPVARQLVGDREHQIDTASETEQVVVFRIVEDNADSAVSFYTHTKSDADRGYSFIAITDLLPGCRRRPLR